MALRVLTGRWEKVRRLPIGRILTDVTALARPSRKAGAVKSTNQIFASVSIEARLPQTLINVCK